MSNLVTIKLEFPSNMVDAESMDISDRLEMMRKTTSGLSTFDALWQYVDFGVIAAIFRREYRDVINAFYHDPKNPTWEAVTEDARIFAPFTVMCRDFSTDDKTGFVVADLEFDDPKLAAVIKLSARTPKNNNTF